MKITSLSTVLAVADVRATAKFYCDNLGFELIMTLASIQEGPEPNFTDGKEYSDAVVQKDGITFCFTRLDAFPKVVAFAENMKSIGASTCFTMQCEGIEAFHAGLQGKNIQMTELKQTPFGTQEFFVKDNNGYTLCFSTGM